MFDTFFIITSVLFSVQLMLVALVNNTENIFSGWSDLLSNFVSTHKKQVSVKEKSAISESRYAKTSYDKSTVLLASILSELFSFASEQFKELSNLFIQSSSFFGILTAAILIAEIVFRFYR